MASQRYRRTMRLYHISKGEHVGGRGANSCKLLGGFLRFFSVFGRVAAGLLFLLFLFRLLDGFLLLLLLLFAFVLFGVAVEQLVADQVVQGNDAPWADLN